MKPPFLVAFALLAIVTGWIVFDLSTGPDLSGGFLRVHRRPVADDVPDSGRPPIAITLDGVNLRPGQGQAASSAPGGARLIVRTLSFELTTDRFHDIQAVLGKWVELHHATIVGEEGTAGRGLLVTLSVTPADAVAAREGVGGLGTITRESPPASEDVTDTHRALLLRIDAARAEERRLTEQLAGPPSGVRDPAGVTRAQAMARTQAERLTAEANALAARAAVVTLVLKFSARQLLIGPRSSADGP
jgi:hypothetical protein